MQIVPFTSDDLSSLVHLQPPDWNDIRPFYQYYLTNDDCRVFKIAEDNELIGTGAFLSHGETAWLAHIIVHPDRRKSGLGKLITSTLIHEAYSMNCKTIYLIATPLGEPVYRKLGFEIEGSYIFYKDFSISQSESADEHIVDFQPSFLDAVLELDKEVSGEERKNRLLPHLPSSKLYVESGELKGFYIPGLGEGLIEALSAEAGLALSILRFMTKNNLTFPTSNTAMLNFMSEKKIEAFKKASRMRLGSERPIKSQYIYGRIGGHLG